jgi:hypothetical protein
VRRDNVEHLILIGGAQDVVIESGISKVSHDFLSPRDNHNGGHDTSDVVPIRPMRPVVFGSKRPTLRPFDATPPQDDKEPA